MSDTTYHTYGSLNVQEGGRARHEGRVIGGSLGDSDEDANKEEGRMNISRFEPPSPSQSSLAPSRMETYIGRRSPRRRHPQDFAVHLSEAGHLRDSRSTSVLSKSFVGPIHPSRAFSSSTSESPSLAAEPESNYHLSSMAASRTLCDHSTSLNNYQSVSDGRREYLVATWIQDRWPKRLA
ncbi:hypothetical protein PM082_011313 [Marasmius tenuissimus]|nr:hypothetical protein PM082_011313 [Marasmius tenuissimus]